jgi:RHS repeat-associated protein
MVGSSTVAFPSTPIYVGLAVTSHNGAATSTATFTNVSMTGNVRTTSSPAYARGYVYGSYVDELLAILPASGVVGDRKFVHSNHLFSVAALTSNTGAVLERYRYDAYGQRTVLAADGTTVRASSSYGNQVGFTGRYLDKETGLWYFRARYYSGSLGRFVSRDSFRYTDGYNLYQAYFVPRGLDPSGHEYEQEETKVPSIPPPNDGNGGVVLGRAVPTLTITWDCQPCCVKYTSSGEAYSDSWKLVMKKFKVRVLILIRTKFPDSETDIPLDGNWQITQENIRNHEQQHADAFKQWHDENEPKAKEDFNTGCKFTTEDKCKITAQMLEAKYQNSLDQLKMFEAAHIGGSWGTGGSGHAH